MIKLPKIDYPEIILLNDIERDIGWGNNGPKDYFRIRLSCHSQHTYTSFIFKNNKVLVEGVGFNDWIEEMTQWCSDDDFERLINRQDIYTFLLNANLRGIEVLNNISDYSELTEDEKNSLNNLKKYDNEKLMNYNNNRTDDEIIENIKKLGNDTYMNDYIEVGTDYFKIKGIDSFKNIL